MKKNIVNLETAKALKELGYKTKDIGMPYYVKDKLYLFMYVEDWADFRGYGTMFIPLDDVVEVEEEVMERDEPILAPTVHKALEWFESKGERYVVKVEFNNYAAEVMQEGTFIPIGRYQSRREAEENILKFYIQISIEEKIHNLKTLLK